MLRLNDNLSAVGSRRKLEVDTLRGHLVNLDFLHTLKHLHTTLHLLGLGGLIAETLNESLYLRHLPLLGALLLIFCFKITKDKVDQYQKEIDARNA